MSVSAFNRRWAAVILEALTRHGVRHICIAPGSRSTPLTLAAAENSAFIHHTHFDERGLGHLALGLAKVSKQPVAVIVTSGTAVANLYPALIEAGFFHSRPLEASPRTDSASVRPSAHSRRLRACPQGPAVQDNGRLWRSAQVF